MRPGAVRGAAVRGSARFGKACRGSVRCSALLGMQGHGSDWLGSWCGVVRYALALQGDVHGKASRVMACDGEVGLGAVHGWAVPGVALHGKVRGGACRGLAGSGVDRRGKAWFKVVLADVRRGSRNGMSRLGNAWPGIAWHGSMQG